MIAIRLFASGGVAVALAVGVIPAAADECTQTYAVCEKEPGGRECSVVKEVVSCDGMPERTNFDRLKDYLLPEPEYNNPNVEDESVSIGVRG